jgi:hypothetical protein
MLLVIFVLVNPDFNQASFPAQIVNVPVRLGCYAKMMIQSGGQTAGAQCTSGIRVKTPRKMKSAQPTSLDIFDAI